MTLKKIAMEKLRKTKGFNILSISVYIISVYVKLHLYFLMRYSLNVKREVININSVFESSIVVYYYLKIVIWKIARVSVNCWYIIRSMQVWHLSFGHSSFMFCNVMYYFEDRRAHYVESYGKRFILPRYHINMYVFDNSYLVELILGCKPTLTFPIRVCLLRLRLFI